MDRLIEDEIARRGLVQGRRPNQGQARDRGVIFNNALLKTVGHKDAPSEVKEALTTEDGDELQLVGDEMSPDPNQEPIE